jgi:hypothetical protein
MTTKPLDPRLLGAGLTVTPEVLTAVFFDHWPFGLAGREVTAPAECPGCGHVYTKAAPECPTAVVARPLLHKRRHERLGLVDSVVWDQVLKVTKALHPPRPLAQRKQEKLDALPQDGLFDATDEMRQVPGRVGITP